MINTNSRPSTRLLLLIAFSIFTLYGISTLISLRVEVHHPKLNPFRDVQKSQQPLSPQVTQPIRPSSTQEKLEDLQIIWSKRNPNGLFNTIDDSGLQPQFYNPTFLELPQSSAHQFMVFGRLRHEMIHIGEQRYRKSRVAVFFANLTKDGFGNPVMKNFEMWNETILDHLYEPAIKHTCERHDYIGPEDVKAWWTTSGAPMLMFTNIYPIGNIKECFSMYMVDARAVTPRLDEALGEYGTHLPPIEFDTPVRLHRAEPRSVEKNWAPFQAPFGPDAGDIFFNVELDGQRAYKFDRFDEYVRPVKTPPSSSPLDEAFYLSGAGEPEQPAEPKRATCLHNLVDKYGYWQIHQGTPVLSMTLCNRGECEPNIHNTVNFGIIQPKYVKPLNWYEPRIATWNITRPFEWRSISKRLTYHGTKSREYVYTMHMSYFFNTTSPPENRAHGFLDDEIWLGFGVADSRGAFMDVDARELMADHHYCDGATSDYRTTRTDF
ncbi:hypothetical protein NA57DRAFT_52481 [Rhizodiscina lignyota]|uniref:Uncharacterized protein n=1 Tax=Rhizodiscina lignyota TaxID=1504668 RepID=A0A9P4MEU2_9PEZI|nr:hypothetical protein NA57DRAFT_52481 [Rhizodiscina lignyota]